MNASSALASSRKAAFFSTFICASRHAQNGGAGDAVQDFIPKISA
jgi:hypothetical protein